MDDAAVNRSRSVSACLRKRVACQVVFPLLAALLHGCTTGDPSTDAAVQSLLAGVGAALVTVAAGIAQGIASSALSIVQRLFTAGGLALFF